MISVAKHTAEMLGVFLAVYTNGEVMMFFNLGEEVVVAH